MGYTAKRRKQFPVSIQDYKNRIKFIRPYTTGFDPSNYNLREIRTLDDLTRKQKAEINRYYKQLVDLKSRATYVYRPRRKDRLKTAQKFGQHAPRFPRIKVAFIPVTGTERPKIKFNKKGQINVTYKNVRRQPLYFEDYGIDPLDLMEWPEETLDDFIGQFDFNAYRVIAGEFEVDIGRTFQNKKNIKDKVIVLMQKYNSNDYDPDDKNSSYWENWMFGVVGYNFKKADDIIDTQRVEVRRRKARERVNKKIKPLKRKLNEQLLPQIKAVKKSKMSKQIKIDLLADLVKEADTIKKRIAELEKLKYDIMSG